MSSMQHYPDVVIRHPASGGDCSGPLAATRTRVVIDGVDFSHAVTKMNVGAEVHGAVELHLTLIVGSVQWLPTEKAIADRELEAAQAAEFGHQR